MSCVAVVDAGYLYAQGSVALTGARKPRISLRLNHTAALAELTAVAHRKSANAQLLRVYWYDGSSGPGGLTTEQSALAFADYFKLRLGIINNEGKQKGVDSLIVTDMIELARNRAISDVVLLSGDEDVRIAVQISQSFGVRVHLLGIAPARGSQSPLLVQEADTTTEWAGATVGRFLTVQAPAPRGELGSVPSSPSDDAATFGVPAVSRATEASGVAELLLVEAGSLVEAIDSAALSAIAAFWATNARGLPSDTDRMMLSSCRARLGRGLTPEERKAIRHDVIARIRARLP